MNITRTLLIARKTLIGLWREPMILLFTLAFPGFFMLLNYIGFGALPKTATYPVWVMLNTPKAAELVERLKAEQYADGRPAFAIQSFNDLALGETALRNQSAAGLLIFDEDADGLVRFTLRGDALNMTFNKASVQLEAILIPVLETAQGKPQPVIFMDKSISLARPISDFDAYAPGMMVFAILLLIPQTAMLVAREIRWGTLRRLELSLLRPAELLGGIALAQMVVAVVQVVLMFASALALGFHNRGSLLLALIIGLILSLGSIGMGLVVACFVRTDTDALNTGSAFSMVQVFLSGAFFAMPMPTLFVLSGYQMTAFDIIPATHAMLALQQVLVGGASFSQVAFRSGAAALLSVLFLMLGIWIFSQRQHAIRA